MVVFTLAINFVNSLEVFPIYESGFEPGGNSSDTFTNITNVEYENDFGFMAILVLFGGVGAAIVLGALIRSPVYLGIALFAAVFWASYINALGVININNWIPAGFLLIGTVVMIFIFAGAIIGMLSGSG